MNHSHRKATIASVFFFLLLVSDSGRSHLLISGSGRSHLLSGSGGRQSLIDLNESPSKGNVAARIILLEFADYQCPFCARFYHQTYPQIDKNYILTGKIRFIFRNFPLERSHPYAFKAAEAAICAGEQGKFWPMHKWLFNFQNTSRFSDWPNYARLLDLDAERFLTCIDAESTATKVRKDISDGKNAGVKVTPTFFLLVTDSNSSQGTIFNKIEGAEDYSTFKKAIDSLIAMENAILSF
jgi:protein-disulfide isomerase